MRDFINAILAFIGAASLTDAEFTAIDQTGLAVSDYSLLLYNQLSAMLLTRESVSTTADRLRYFFLSKGVAITTTATGKSNIYIGDAL